jgi:membrane protein DedA with SNARE-associated domain/rhodanese-related sulfurtransferase
MSMDTLLQLFPAHGVLAIFLIVFAKRMGVPIPVIPFLLLAGARGAQDAPYVFAVLAAATLATTLADGVWFAAGRRFGIDILALVCRISLSADTCIRKSRLTFLRHGTVTVLFARFVPGVGGLAPPLAGALGMRVGSFAGLNLAGSLLWVGASLAAGLLLQDQVAAITGALRDLGSQAVPLLLTLAAAYVGWLGLRRFLVTFAALRAPRMKVEELAEQMARGEPVVVVDVRGSALAKARIPGARHAESDRELLEALTELPDDTRLVAYCDCPNDVSAARMATRLRKRGLAAQVLTGGFSAWVAAGLPVHSDEAAALPEAALAAQSPAAAPASGPEGAGHVAPITQPAAVADAIERLARPAR